MPFDMTCNMCGVMLRLQENQVGSIINCPSCGQLLFVQLPTEASSTGDTPPVSQETLAVHAGPSEPELPDFLKPAAAIAPAVPELAPQALAETDTVSSLAEMLGGEETGSAAAPIEPAPSPVGPAAPVAFTPPTTPPAQPGQPEFFLPGAMDESTSTTVAAFGTATPSAAPAATTPTQPPSRFGVMAAFYVSGVIFGLIIGKFVFGRAAVAAGPTGLEAVRDDGVLRDKTKWVDPKAALPPSQLKQLGETVQIAGLSITARAVERAKVTKVHSFGGSKETSQGVCLVLHLLLKNTSKDVEFAPLDPMFVRPHSKHERPTYSFIEVVGSDPIEMFDLHKFSEFDLEGQPFDAIKPGEEIEAIIAAAEDSPSQTKGKMRWRVQVRAGVPEEKAYTTVVGFEFTPDQIRG